MGKRIKKVLITAGVVTLMLAGGLIGNTSKVPSFGGITAYASEIASQSTRWEGTGDVWRLRTADGKGYVSNSWFQDIDQSWYMIDSNGQMLSGLITDQSTGKSYYLEINHNGLFGKMQTVNGVYNINGQNIHLTFNESHDGSYGCITSGLSEARSAGISETQLANIPTDSSTSSTSTSTSDNQSSTSGNQNTTSENRGNTSGGYINEYGYWVGNTMRDPDTLTEEEWDQVRGGDVGYTGNKWH